MLSNECPQSRTVCYSNFMNIEDGICLRAVIKTSFLISLLFVILNWGEASCYGK